MTALVFNAARYKISQTTTFSRWIRYIPLMMIIAVAVTSIAPTSTQAQGIAPPSTCSRQRPSTIYTAGTSGGSGGDWFSDTSSTGLTIALPDSARVSSVIVSSGNYIDGIQIVYTINGKLSSRGYHGGSGGTRHEFQLAKDEYITGIQGRSGDFVDSLIIRTNKRSSPEYGGDGGANYFSYDIPPQSHLVGFWGRDGDFIDAIGIEYRHNC